MFDKYYTLTELNFMKINLSRYGGFMNRRVGYAVDTDKLPEPEATEIIKSLDDIKQSNEKSSRPDRFEYVLTVDDGKISTYRFKEGMNVDLVRLVMNLS